MSENEISKIIVDACYRIHSQLGPGLFESVYEKILFIELEKAGLKVFSQVTIPVIWDNIQIDQGFRADLIVNYKVIVEIKSVEAISPVHHKQLLTYLRLSDMKLGLLINFNEKLIKEGITRIGNNL